MNIQSKPTILFFDSGVGGLSVYQEVKQLLPDYHYLYCFDNAYFPYSEKPEEGIVERTLKICQRIDNMYPLDLIVIACNTASTVVLPVLRKHFSIPIVGTVPAIKPAAEQTQTKHIGLLATKGTVKRQYLSDLIDKYASFCQVEKIGSTKLVELAELKLHGYPIDLNEIKKYCSEESYKIFYEKLKEFEKEAIDYKNIGKFLEVKLVEDEKDRKIRKFLKFLDDCFRYV